ncbi:phosphoserine phosphatase [Sphingobium sp. B1D7B]|uniref:phosphoserine phosphatase SerB n=1 Tax=unclassified Sphingobium TaxID=2611147 RepID=UPI0022244D0F|nr:MULTISPECIES: phosphoserine phosphatase SerB [unclassified Sphingobium]MCW2390374.1 phosphoserine phosphatase [Sphingobium sp. B11D3A]MCW2405515.1 phosphoserine phosphatase [Sphingobium sp. B1D7B]
MAGGISDGRDMIATLVAHDGLGQGDVTAARDALAQAGLDVAAPVWIEAGEAVDLPFAGDRAVARAALEALAPPADLFVLAAANRDCRLFVADMDSTMITVECIDELADYAGLKDEIAAVTERAMRGELDFAQALTGRVALLKGLDATMIDRCRAERVRLMPGARALVQTLRSRGARTILVSGGFVPFAQPVAQEIGFDVAIANTLHIADGKLAGTVGEPIVDAARKRAELLGAAQQGGLAPAQSIAIGDGANDIPMIEAAGLGVAYHAKPKTRAAADAAIERGDLSVLLHALGIARAQWVTG